MLVMVPLLLPFDPSTAHGLVQNSVSQGRVRSYYGRHSGPWWRRYRARLRRKGAVAMAHRRVFLAPKLPQFKATRPPSATLSTNLPIGWNGETTGDSTEMRFRTGTVSGSVPGEAMLAVVAQSRPTPGYLTRREERRMLAGTAVADLRRIVIDKMITAGGWVVNDYQRDMAGCRVFVVTAQTPGDLAPPRNPGISTSPSSMGESTALRPTPRGSFLTAWLQMPKSLLVLYTRPGIEAIPRLSSPNSRSKTVNPLTPRKTLDAAE